MFFKLIGPQRPFLVQRLQSQACEGDGQTAGMQESPGHEPSPQTQTCESSPLLPVVNTASVLLASVNLGLFLPFFGAG